MKQGLIFISIILVLNSCQKEIDPGLASGINGDYQPVSANSEWNYNSTSAGTYLLRSLGTDSTINGKKYYKFDRIASAGSVRSYISKINGVYRQFGNFAPINTVIEMIFLKDSAIGTTWTEIINVSGFKNYHKYTITAKDIQRTVNGAVFKNVIELNYELSLDNPLGGPPIIAGGGKNYYAKNVGAIESFFSVGFMGFNVSDTTRLTNFSIK